MNLLVVTNDFPAASETFISNKVLKFIEKGYSVTVVCTSFRESEWKKINLAKIDVDIEEINQKKLFRFFLAAPKQWFNKNKTQRAEFLFQKYFLRIIGRKKPDVVHFEFSGIGIQYTQIFDRINALKIVSCRGSAEKVKLLVSSTRKEKVKNLFKAVDKIHCVSENMRQTILPYCSQPSKIFINYPSIDADIFKRSRIYQLHSPVQILSVGRLTFQKGYLIGLLAMKKLKQHNLNFKWTIIGEGQQQEEIIFHINEMQLNKQVELGGKKNREEIISLYNNADIFFLPSVYEGIANAALEAMSMELPVVVSKSGGMEEVIVHDKNGLITDVYDFNMLANFILKLSADEEKCKALGNEARQTVIQKFALEKNIHTYEKIYNAL